MTSGNGMVSKLDTLIKHRDAILIAEIGALIHDLGKLSEEFVIGKSSDVKELENPKNIDHHLILKRLISRDDPILKQNIDQKNALAYYAQTTTDQIIKEIIEYLLNPSNGYDLSDINIENSIRNHVVPLLKTHSGFNVLEINRAKNKIKDFIKIFQDQKDSEEKIPSDFIISKYLRDILSDNLNKSLEGLDFSNKTTSIGDFIEKHHKTWNNKTPDLVELLKAPIGADGIDSEIDKGAVINLGQQISSDNSISTAFGHEYEQIKLINLKKYRDKFILDLEKSLNYIKNNGEHLSFEDWLRIRKGILDSTESHFKKSLGETRRSANDVTLWDHSYSVASLFKSSLAHKIMGGKEAPVQMKWRLLSIHFDGPGFWMMSKHIGDILGRKSILKKAMDAVKQLLEVYMPIGNQVYEDENGIVFLVPESVDDSFLKNEIISMKNNTFPIARPESRFTGKPEIFPCNLDGKSSDAAINTFFEIISDGELKPLIEVTEPTRGAQILGNLLNQRKKYNIPISNKIEIPWQNANRSDKKKICHICGLKPIGGSVRENELKQKNLSNEKKKAEERKICLDCHIRRTNRVNEWLDKRKRTKDTLWIDEVADNRKVSDSKNKLALIAGKFELTDWLNGYYLNTVFTKNFESIKNRFTDINNFDDLIKAAIEAFDKNGPDESLSFKKANNDEMKVRYFLTAIGGKSYRQSEDNSGMKRFPTAEKYFEDVVLNREGGLIKNIGSDPEKTSNEQKAKLLITALFRKNPSFARIRRLWESTDEFWTSIESEIKETLNDRNTYRYCLKSKITNKIHDSIYKTHAYELRRNGIQIPVVYSDESEFITIDKIELENPEESLKGKYDLYESSGYGIKSKRIAEAEILMVEKDSEYIPYIQILKEPLSFMALVPLEHAFSTIRSIKKEYEIQFSKVQNRLPIKLGMIAFNRMMPLYTVIDAANRFFEEDININSWKVKEETGYSSADNCKNFEGKLGNFVKKFILEGETENKIKRDITCCVSYSLGDPSKKDEYYPYFEVKGDGISSKNSYFKTLTIKENEFKEFTLLHVTDIDKNMEIDFRPSIFDFELLDSNSRRFDFGRNRNHWLFGKNGPKPYLLWDIDKFVQLDELISKTGLTTTQVLNAYEMLIGTLEDWELKELSLMNNSFEFKNLVECAIRDVPLNLSTGDLTKKGQITREDFNFLSNCMMNGMFCDYVDLVHTILKKEFGGIK